MWWIERGRDNWRIRAGKRNSRDSWEEIKGELYVSIWRREKDITSEGSRWKVRKARMIFN